jgi:microcystin-dependent protein
LAEPFLSEIRIMSFNFPPKGWAFCNGQLLPINQNQALFSLLGTTYGGDGRVTFALPNLQGRVPIHAGSTHLLGQNGGTETHTLTLDQMPAHAHGLQATGNPGTTPTPAGSVLAQLVSASTPDQIFHDGFESPDNAYGPPQSLVPMSSQAVGYTGNAQPHSNLQPYLALHFCIALQGIFPSRN